MSVDASPLPSAQDPSLLIADGNAFGRDFARLALRRSGFARLTPVRNGAEAAEALGARPDLILLDWDLAVLPAVEVLRLAAGSEGGAPPVVVTMSRPTRAAVEAASAEGANSVLAKPISAERLRTHVAAALAARRQGGAGTPGAA